MKFQYLGTAAAEAFPALFCQCDVCTRARAEQGKNIRGRSGAVLDDSLLIDFPPDIYWHSLRFHIPMGKIKDIVITHTHLDHFDAGELMMRFPDCFCHIKDGEQFINLHGNEEAERVLNSLFNYEFGKKMDFVRFHLLKKFEKQQIGDFVVTPLPALHKLNENAFFYLIEKQGKSMLYAHDTGIFYDEVFAFLKEQEVKLDFISYDCTMGTMKDGGNHLGIPDVVEVKQRLARQGNLKENTIHVLNHFSHNCGLLHNELEAEAEKIGALVSYDGMVVEF